MEVGALSLTLQAIGADAVTSSLNKVRSEFDKTGRAASQFDGVIGSVKDALVNFAAGITIGAVLNRIVVETKEAEFAQAQLAAALRSTRNVAGQTVDALNAQAAALSRLSVFDDDVITGAQALLLTFTKIQGDVFPKATEAVLNVAQAMGTDLRSAAIQVGKALNDPILGVAALARSGIQFTEAQKDMIKQLVESNRLLDAQKIILSELETQFGGSAKAARDTFGGALTGLANDFGNAMTLSKDGADLAAWYVNRLAEKVRQARQDFDTLAAAAVAVYTNVRGFFRIFGAMELRSGYAEAYARITSEMRASREEVARLASGAEAVAPPTQQAAAYIEKMTGSTLAGASAFGLLSDQLFRTGTATKDFLAGFKEKPQGIGGAATKAIGRTLAEAQAAMTGRPTVGRTPTSGPSLAIDPAAIARLAQSKEIDTSIAQASLEFQAKVANGFAQALGNGIAAAFEVGLSTKSIGNAFKALTGTLLSSFGSMLVQFGQTALVANKAIQGMFKTLFTPGPQGIVASMAIIAIGASLMAAGRGITSGVQSSAGGGFMTSPGGGGGVGAGPMTLPGLSFGPTTAGASANIAAAQPLTINVIGANDPSAQRQMQDLIRNAQRRGNTTTV